MRDQAFGVDQARKPAVGGFRHLTLDGKLAKILGRQPVRQLLHLLHGGWRHDLLPTVCAGMRDNDDDDPYRAIMIVASTA